MFPFETYELFQSAHKKWVEHTLTSNDLKRKSHWTQSIATGSKSFVMEIHSKLGYQARYKQIVETKDGYQVCERISSYNALFDAEKSVIDGENSLFWDDYS